MTPEQLRTVLAEAARTTVGAAGEPAGTVLRRSHDGQWQSTIALRLNAEAPERVAARLAEAVRTHPDIDSVAVSGPGFLHITVAASSLLRAVAEIVDEGSTRPADHAEAVHAEPVLDSEAVRYASARTPVGAPLSPDPGLLRTARDDNPLHLVQHAHADAHRLLRRAADAGIPAAATARAASAPDATARAASARDASAPDASALDAEECRLLVRLTEFPSLVARAAHTRSPRLLTTELEGLARDHLDWARAHVLVPPVDQAITGLHAARGVLVAGTREVLARGLRLLGVRAPERM